MVVTSFKEHDFALPKFDLKLELADWTVSDDVKKKFNSSDTTLIKPDKISGPSYLKEKLFSQSENIRKMSKEIQLKSLAIAYKNIFQYDIENVITDTFVTELNENTSTYGLISFSSETKTDYKLHLITPHNKLKFNLKNDIYKNMVGFELDKGHTKTSFSTTRDYVLNFGILCSRKNKTVGEKGTMPMEIMETIHVLGLQNFVNYERMNLIEVTLDSNVIIERLANYEKYKYRFLVENLLFSSNLENDTNVIFITFDGLSDAKDALINSKVYKTFGVVHLSEIKNWNIVKGESERSQTVFVDSEYHTKSSHFGFAFKTKKVSDLFNFTVTLLDGSGNKITFPSNETKVPTIAFKIQIVK